MPSSVARRAALAIALLLAIGALALPALPAGAGASAAACTSTVIADVVVFDTPIMFNRLGAQNPNWITYALRRDVASINGGALAAGNVQMRKDKRVRPLTLRVNEGECLQVNFQNYLADTANPFVNPDTEPPINPGALLKIDDQVRGRHAGFHIGGLQLVGGIGSDASFVGRNTSSLVPPNGTATYTYYAPPGSRGTYLADSDGATFGGEASAGNAGQGMFAAVNVEPAGARWYRSQVTEEELRLATRKNAAGALLTTAGGQPLLDYEAVYPEVEPWISEGKATLPVLNMRQGNRIVHGDLNAVIAGPHPDGSFPASTYPLEGAGKRNPAVPNRLEAFREFTVVFHDEVSVGQAFPGFFNANPVTARLLHGVRDTFMVNYGSGGVGAEIIANRLGVGPMHDCLACSFEEFFLASSAVGDPAMLVDMAANVGLEACDVAGNNCEEVGPKASKAFFPDDPSNVHHSYVGDRVVFRNLHAGKEHHIFHLHNHQWLFDANDDNANYLDAQAIGPASGYTYEINFGGAGNRNKSAGDAIFHCHFYPHFAQGMWELWRIHDVFEAGTRLAASGDPADPVAFHGTPFALFDGTPAVHPQAGQSGGIPASARTRALPDGEILAGTPIPAVVPLPGAALAPMPGEVVIVQKNANPPQDNDPDSSQAHVIRTDVDGEGKLKNPGYPFWIAGVDCGGDADACTQGVVGQRAPTPPLDMLSEQQAQQLRAEEPALFAELNPLAGSENGGWDGGLPRHSLDGFLAVQGATPGRLDPGIVQQEQTKLSFAKEFFKAKPVWFPEGGTDLEQVAMRFHGEREHPSVALQLGSAATPAKLFVTNGAPPQAGSPFFEPCVDDRGRALFAGEAGQWFGATPGSLVSLGTSPFNATSPRVYKGANIQVDAVFNKLGYHYPQQRIVSLWEDVLPTINKQKPPEVFVIRNNTLDCTRYLHTNLAPHRFEVDDYEVTTPTDVIGQHIHLPKWDLPSADGSANGWNYEDGTLAPKAVRERIHAINAFNPAGTGNPSNSAGAGADQPLVALPHPYFGGGQGGEWQGARTTIQRWMFDPVLNVHDVDRGLGIIFTHDHFGPSTVQQVGLYASVLTEPAGSVWKHNETGADLYTRPDGGPTSWQAAILPGSLASQPAQFEPFREFWFQHSDFQHAYEAGTYIGAGPDGRPNGVLPDANSFRKAINPSVRVSANPVFPDVVLHPANCLDGTPRPCPEAITADDPGFFVTNYRNEPLGWRVFDPAKPGPDGKPGSQTDGQAGDLAFALQTRTDRAVAQLNTPYGDTPYPTLNADVKPGDPFTPMMRAYAGDLVRIKSQAGGDEAEHNFSLTGVKWLQGGSAHGRAPNSGWRNAQHRGISEQFTFAVPVVPFVGQAGATADYPYSHSTGGDGWWSGMWGLMRTYRNPRNDLFKLPTTQVPVNVGNPNDFAGVCPRTAPSLSYDITAVLANDVLGNALGVTIPGNLNPTDNAGGPLKSDGGTLVYNPRATGLAATVGGGTLKAGPLHDPTAMLYVRTADLEPKDTDPNTEGVQPGPGCFKDGVLDPKLPTCPVKLRAGAPVEPIVLRATAGACINVMLRNRLPQVAPDLAGFSQLIAVVPRDKESAEGLTWFGNNHVRPSSYVGLQPQLVAFDVTRAAGTVVGTNPPTQPVVAPGEDKKFQWYAGAVGAVPGSRNRINLAATAIELGGANLIPADIIKQPQKGLVGALSVGPAGAAIAETDQTWDHQQADNSVDATTGSYSVPRETRASGTFNGNIRDFALVFQQGLNLRYADGTAVENLTGGEAGPLGAAQKAINYGTEPMWFRFGLLPDVTFRTLGAVPNPEEAYSNALVGGDPATPVFTAAPGAPVRMHVLYPAGNSVDDLHDRGIVFQLHGHLWQRAPYICPNQDDGMTGLTGKCDWTDFGSGSFEPGSRAIGVNPIGMYLGAQESVLPAGHFTVVLPGAGSPNGGAGGVGQVTGDYLFRDQGSFGNTQGLWGILRVAPTGESTGGTIGGSTGGGKGKKK